MLNFCDFIQDYVFSTNHHLKLCSKYSVLGLGGTKQPAVEDLNIIPLFLEVKFSEIYLGSYC